MPKAIPNTFRLSEDCLTAYMTIRNLKGETFVVEFDADDLAAVQMRQWCIRHTARGRYPSTNANSTGDRKMTLGNYLLSPSGDMVAHYLDDNTLNCRRTNIVDATREQVSRDTEQPLGVTGQRYIQYDQARRRYTVIGPRLPGRGPGVYGGDFVTLDEAIVARERLLEKMRAA